MRSKVPWVVSSIFDAAMFWMESLKLSLPSRPSESRKTLKRSWYFPPNFCEMIDGDAGVVNRSSKFSQFGTVAVPKFLACEPVVKKAIGAGELPVKLVIPTDDGSANVG